VDEEGIAMDETRIYSVDSETFNELSHANDELIQYLQWLIERKDLEAINKLSPIVRRTTDLFLAILEGAFPEISHLIDSFNKLRDEITERIARASTPEEIEQLSTQVDELTSDYQKRINEVVAETKRLENRVRSSEEGRLCFLFSQYDRDVLRELTCNLKAL
jgi:methyl-accepting chemotaxis protein